VSTRPRIYGAEFETPFGKWLRAREELDAVAGSGLISNQPKYFHEQDGADYA